ncbi:MAG: response regulator transcription factor [Candidatus Eiseniibacteriota bacterium]
MDVVEHDRAVRSGLCELLRSNGFSVRPFENGREFLAAPACPDAGCVLLDLDLPDVPALELVSRLRGGRPVVVLAAHANVATAVEVMHAGAYWLLEKPFAAEVLLERVRRASHCGRTGSSRMGD